MFSSYINREFLVLSLLDIIFGIHSVAEALLHFNESYITSIVIITIIVIIIIIIINSLWTL